MGKLSAKSNAFGSYLIKETTKYSVTTYYHDGTTSTSTGSPIYEAYGGRREGKSKNPIKTKNGTFPWRDPSGYRRTISEVRPITSEETWYNPKSLTKPKDIVKQVFSGGPRSGPALNNICWPSGYCNNSPYPNYDAALTLNVVNRADVECMIKLGSRKAEIAQTLAEAGKSFDLLVDGATTLLKVAIAVKRGNIGLALKHLGVRDARSIGKRYLQYVYGVKPLASDIYGAYQLFKEGLEVRPRIKATRTITEQFQRNGALGWNSSKGPYNSGKLSVRTHLEAVLSDQYLRTAQRAGIINPVSLAWELMPWSFVIDWVIPVGKLIEASTAASGLTFHSGWRVALVDSEGDWYQSAPPGWNGSNSVGYHVSHWGFRRDPLAKFPIPKPFYVSPFKTAKALNAVALLTQLVK